jgi:hypothetical protein
VHEILTQTAHLCVQYAYPHFRKFAVKACGYNLAIMNWNMNDGALDHILWRTRFGRGYGPVARQAT